MDLRDNLNLPSSAPKKRTYRICFASDFFYPSIGGVEMHQYQLAQCLMEMGHRVIVVTKAYNNRKGVRYLSNGLKVYYLPYHPALDTVIMPGLLFHAPLYRKILIREQIEILHWHQATSSLGHEIQWVAKGLGLRVIYSDHSLFGFGDAASINLNKEMKIILSDSDAAICVSYTCKENLALRAQIDPQMIFTIPNAVDSTKFTPDPSRRFPLNTKNIVVLSRLAYRKGIDLLVDIIPSICKAFPEAYFIIGGDGPKRYLVEEMRDKYRLHNRVEMLGSVPYEKVRDVLVRGHIFLNTSLTESFCTAIVEAASCGLLVVSTNVGGVPEVLPPEMRYLAPPKKDDLVLALKQALEQAHNVPSHKFHEMVKDMYSWHHVAIRTEKVYNMVMASKPNPLLLRVRMILSAGPWVGIFALLLFAMFYIVLKIMDKIAPAEKIEKAVDFPYETYKYSRHLLNHHLDLKGDKKS